MKILNLYAGVGGNSLFWDGHDVVAIEYTEELADIYSDKHPNHEIIVADAHQYLLDHHEDFNFVWSSPPCQSHSRMIRSGKNRKPRYPDLRLYEEILFLTHSFNGLWVVENVVPYYDYLIEPETVMGRHVFWSNCELNNIEDEPRPDNFINLTDVSGMRKLQEWLGIYYKKPVYYEGNHCPAQVLRNCVHPKLGRRVLDKIVGEFLNG